MAKIDRANRFVLSVQVLALLVSVCFASSLLPLSEKRPRLPRSSSGCTLTLYDGDIGSFPSLQLTTSDSSLADNDWDDRTSSAVVSGECQWILYDLTDFEENDNISSVIGPRNYPFNFSNNETTFGLPDNVLSAVRCLPAEGTPAVALFEHHRYFGEMQVIFSSNSNLSLINFNDAVSSLVITGGMWEFYSEANYTGSTITLGQGLYPNADSLIPIENDNLTSVRLIDCGTLNDTTNGQVSHTAGTTFGQTATYSCDTGYNLVGDSTRTCQAGGVWSGDEPTCINTFIAIISESATLTAGSTGMFVCVAYGCPLPSLTWSRGGTFLSNNSQSTIYERQVVETQSNETFVQSILVICSLTQDDAAQYNCSASNNISSTSASFNLTVNLVECGTLNATTNGQVNHTAGTTFGHTATYSCDTGYTLEGSSTRTCQTDGMWSGSEPTCQVVDCGTLNTTTNGQVSHPNGTTFGQTATYSCDTGYTLQLVGDSTRTCQADGMWSGNEPTCIIVDCGTPNATTNGQVSHSAGTTFGQTATYSCDTGYILEENSTRTCQATGMWSGSAPSCQAVDCGILNATANGQVSHPNGTTFGQTATYSCDAGYILEENSTRTCQADGVWSGNEPTCIIVPCRTPNALANGQLGVQGNPSEQTATYSCDTGYNLVGNSTRTCLAGGVWSGSEPTCQAVDCGTLNDTTNGQVSHFNETTFGQTATYSCDTGYNLMGDNTRTCQADGMWSGNEPTCIIVDCGTPNATTNGQVNHTAGTSFGQTATYSCDTGYILDANSTRTCQATGVWSGSAPTCQAVDCGILNATANGQVSHSNGTTFGQTATYSCDTGYTLVEYITRTCQADGVWSGIEPTCITVDCGTLNDTTNGQVSHSNGTTFGQRATYSCDTGYNLMGDNTRTCQAGGMWSGNEPTCIIVSCDALTDPANGQVSHPNITTFGQTAIYSCDTGYYLLGNHTRRCQADGMWSGYEPTCINTFIAIISESAALTAGSTGMFVCVAYGCPLPSLTWSKGGTLLSNNSQSTIYERQVVETQSNETFVQSILVICSLTPEDAAQYNCSASNNISSTSASFNLTVNPVECGTLNATTNGQVNHSAGTTFGQTATYSCDTGYTLEGISTRTCQANGMWSGSEPTCQVVECGTLNATTNGQVNHTAGTTFGQTATYSCDTGYTLEGISTRTCQANGMWSGSEPTCQVVECGTLNATTNGQVNHTAGTTFGQTATYSCDTGYTLEGISTRTCQANGMWSGSEPTCQVVECGTLNATANGQVNHTAGTTFGQTATYSCDTGYTLEGISTRTCQANGMWSGSEPTCQVVECGTLNVTANGQVNHTAGTTFGQTATYSCDTGYTLEGISTRTCQANGMWSGSEPTCQVVDCGTLNTTTNGQVSHPNGTTFGQTATYSCDTGYTLQLVGDSTRTCQADGMWSGNEPTCIIVDCGTLNATTSGQVNHTAGTSFGQTATYSCDTGYNLEGNRNRTCQVTGVWSGSAPSCQAVDCGTLNAIANGQVSHPNGTTFGQTATYSCDTGYYLLEDITRTCQANGVWSGIESTCIIVPCRTPNALANGQLGVQGNPSEQTATYSCDTGYNLVGNSTRTCLAGGVWSGSEPTCQAVDCGTLNDTTNGQVSHSNGTTFGQTATYSCDTGYNLMGDNTRTCQADGMWSGNEPTCIIVSCDALTDPANGQVSHTAGTTFGQTATYSCDTGYNLVGDSTRMCQATGVWSGTEPTCQATGRCDANPTGILFCPVTEGGTTQVCSCSNSAVMISRTCSLSGVWDSVDPSLCTSFSSINTGTITLDNYNQVLSNVSGAVRGAATSEQEQTTSNLTVVAAAFERSAARLANQVTSIPNTTVQNLVETLEGLQQWNMNVLQANASNIVRSYEGIVSMFAQRLEGRDPIPFRTENILVVTEQLPRVELAEAGRSFSSGGQTGNASINTLSENETAAAFLPPSLFQSITDLNSIGSFFAVYSSGVLFPIANVTTVVGTPVLAATVGSGLNFSNLAEPVRVLLRLNELESINSRQPRCVSWSFTVQEWTTDGCVTDLAEVNEGVVTCNCSHLTNFAVLTNVICSNESTGVLSWPDTVAGTNHSLQCPNTSTMINRTCSSSGVWDSVDPSLCTSFTSINTANITLDNYGEVLTSLSGAVRGAAINEQIQNTNDLAKVAATFERSAALINEMTIVPNTTVRSLIEILEGLQQWDEEVLQANASNIMRSFDTIVSIFAQQLESNMNFSVMTENVLFVAEAQPQAELAETGRSFSADSGTGNTNITTLSVNETAAAYLPASLFQSITNRTSVGIVFALYDTGALFPITNATQQYQETDASTTTVVGSPVLGVTVGPGLNFSNLTESVRILLRLNEELENVTNLPRCVSWNFDRKEWTTDGCETLAEVNESIVTCHCNHLTNFAILVDICSRFQDCMLSPSLQAALQTLTIVGVVLSLTGIVLTVFTLLFFKKFRQRVATIFHVQLCIALFCMLIIFVCGIDKTAVYGGCVAVSALIHYFTLVAVMFMGAEAVLMFQKLVIVFGSTSTKFFVTVSLICWLVPIIPVVIPMALDLTDAVSGDLVVRVPTPQSQGFCFIDDPAVFFGAFLGPIFAILIVNVVMFVLVIGVIIRHTRSKLVRTKEQMKKRTAIRLIISIAGIMFLFGLTWLFGALTVTGFGSATASFAFQVLFVICNAFQGFFIFLFFCVFNKDARDLWIELLSFGRYKSKQLHSSQVKYASSGGTATLEKIKTTSSGLTGSNLVSAVSSKSGYNASIDDLSKEERYTDVPLTSTAEQEKEMPSVVTFKDDPEIQETNVGTDQKDDLESSEVKEKEQVLETSKSSEKHASSNSEVGNKDLQTAC